MSLIRKITLAAMFGLFGGLSQTQPLLGAPVRGVPGDLWADRILGQPDFNSLAPFDVTAKRLFNQGGVLIDRVSTPQRLYVYDAGNSRVLGFSDISVLSPNATLATVPNWQPDIILGQPDFTHSGCNKDSNYQNYPALSVPGADTLCGLPEGAGSPREGGSGANMAVDAQGNLYVPDFWNNRVLRYNAPVHYAQPADYVWGQGSFQGRTCNGGGAPSPSGLCFESGNNANVAGVAIDSAGNLWVADMGNNRVLRFPVGVGGIPQTTADLVLGQSDLYSNTAASGTNDLTHMYTPSAVRVDASGNVYVTDFYVPDCGANGQKGRVLVYKAPIVSGQSALGAIHQYLSLPMALEFDPDGGLWVSDYCTDQMLLFDITLGTTGITATVRKTLLTDQPNPIGVATSANAGDGPDIQYQDGATQASYRAISPMGGVGVDRSGNVFVGLGGPCDVWRFPAPIPTVAPTTPTGPTFTAHSSDISVFKPRQYGMLNDVGSIGMHQGIGVAAAAGQLIVADTYRLMYWNMPSGPTGLTNGKAADGFAGVDASDVFYVGKTYSFYGHNYSMGRIREDHAAPQRLWAVRQNDVGPILEAYRLPLTSYATPDNSLPRVLPLVGGAGAVSLGSYLAGLAPDRDGTRDYVWVADEENNRVLRIRTPLTNPQVDIILGQPDATSVLCNQASGDYPPPNAKTFCNPGQVTLDHHGNLYVSDFVLEFRGNQRLLRYNAGDIQNYGNTPIYGGGTPGISASAVYGRNGDFTLGYLQCQTPPDPTLSPCGPWEPAFTQDDSTMVLGTMYIGSQFPLVFSHPGESPLLNQWPLTHTNDFGSTYYGGTFDQQNNLYVTDLNRSRVLVYFNPFATPPATPTPSGTPIQTYTVTITPTPTWTPTKTWTPTITATDTATPTPSYTNTPGSPTATPTQCCLLQGDFTPALGGGVAGGLPIGFAEDGAGNSYIASLVVQPNVIYRVNTTGTQDATFGINLMGVTGLAIGRGLAGVSSLFAVSWSDGSFYRYSLPSGAASNAWLPASGGLQNPGGICQDPDGTLYITEVTGNRVRIFAYQSQTDTYIEKTALTGLNGPRGLDYDAGYLCVTDSGNQQVLRYQQDLIDPTVYGAPVTVVSAAIDPTLGIPYAISADHGGHFAVTSDRYDFRMYDGPVNQVFWGLMGKECGPGSTTRSVAISRDADGHLKTFVILYPNELKKYGLCAEPPIPTLTRTLSVTGTPTATASPTASWTSTSTPTQTSTPTLSWTLTPTPSPTWTWTFTPTSTPTFTWTVTWTPTPTGSATATPTPIYPGQPVICQPNPVKGGGTVRVWWTPRGSRAPERIYLVTVADRVLRRIDSGALVSGQNFIDLELKDRWGRPLANGLYYVVVEQAGQSDVGKLVVLR